MNSRGSEKNKASKPSLILRAMYDQYALLVEVYVRLPKRNLPFPLIASYVTRKRTYARERLLNEISLEQL